MWTIKKLIKLITKQINHIKKIIYKYNYISFVH